MLKTSLAIRNYFPLASLLLSGFFALLFSSVINANNGEIAHAYPINPIKVDGDLSDWPDFLRRYPIKRFYLSNHPKNEEDYKASYRVAYNLDRQQLYIALEVQDDSHIVDTAKTANWMTQDSHLLYLDDHHDGSAGILYILNEQSRDITGNENAWDPKATKASWEGIEAKVSHSGNTTVYEWSFQLGDHIQAGRCIGLDHVVTDRDADDEKDAFSFIAWGPNTGKSRSPDRLGDVLLVAPYMEMGKVNGQLKWAEGFKEKTPKSIRFHSTSQADWSITASVDTSGTYSVDLPVGSYKLTLPYIVYGEEDIRVTQNSDIQFVVKKDQETVAPAFVINKHPEPDLIPKKGLLHQFSNQNEKEIDEFVTAYMEYYSIPGVSLALVKDNQLVYHKTYGYSNAYTREAVKEETLFEAASITKSVFAFAMNRLVERGVIDLDKPLYQYLPFPEIAHDDRYKLITGRHVLSHQTGFPNWAWMNEDGKIDIKFTPGTQYGYSGEGFEYLGRVIAHITGKDLETILREEVLEPFNLYHTHFSYNEELERTVSFGHYDDVPTPKDITRKPGMAYSMHTEAKAFTNFMIGLLKKEHLSAEGYRKMLSTERTIEDDEPEEGDWPESFGLGFHLMESPYGQVFGHGGNNGDFQCLYEIYPEQKMGWVAYTNNDYGSELCDKLQEFLITGKQSKTQ